MNHQEVVAKQATLEWWQACLLVRWAHIQAERLRKQGDQVGAINVQSATFARYIGEKPTPINDALIFEAVGLNKPRRRKAA